jgi:hypothetical protein
VIRVHDGLFVGGLDDCFHDERDGWAVVHACKDPCHKRAIGYTGNLHQTHPCYLVCERGSHLFLNLIDPPRPLFQIESFVAALDFIRRHWGHRHVLVHCNQANSRAPSLAMLFLARRLRVIDDTSFAQAQAAFRELYRDYDPGPGLSRFLRDHWDEIR